MLSRVYRPVLAHAHRLCDMTDTSGSIKSLCVETPREHLVVPWVASLSYIKGNHKTLI